MPTRRARGERGAALVEAALIIPIILMLTFGTIEFGFAFSEQGTVRASTRSAARSISTQPKADAVDFYNAGVDNLNLSVSNLLSGRPDFALIYEKTLADGPTTPAECTARLDCMVFDWTGTAFQSFATATGDPWEKGERHACAGETDQVGVFLAVRHDWVTGLPFVPGMGDGVNLSASTVMALEPHAGSGCTGTS